MFIKRVTISNFRSIKHASIEFGETTVLIGPNNAGKSAVLEALRIALTRRWGQRGTGFTEYDVHLCDTRPDPKEGEPVVIEIELQEDRVGDWPADLLNELNDIIQPDPITGRSAIFMRVSCAWDAAEESYVPRWEFLNVDRNPLAGRGARATNFQEFFQFLPVFYLEALRDANSEFSVRSQFWGRLLKSVQIPEQLEKRSKRIFDLLNRKILDADPLLTELATGLTEMSSVAASDAPGTADLRVLPLNAWDLLSKAEVIYQTETTKPWLPLERHGQGLQSLSVMFLFKAFVELLLADLYRPESTAVLAMEEPETHLHPQASRSLWRHVEQLSGQKIVTTHSPYFLQHVPFRDIRVLRAGANGTTVSALPKDFRAKIPHLAAIDTIVGRYPNLLNYDRGAGHLVISGELTERAFRELCIAYAGQTEVAEIHSELRRAYDQSRCFVPDEDLSKLETFARRIRGEIFFAKRWLLVEGQSDYHIIHGLARGMSYDLDEHGVSVIDFKNCGNPDSFAVLARALGYPWIMLVDGDTEGLGYIDTVRRRGFQSDEIDIRAHSLPAGDMEAELVSAGLQDELKQILTEIGIPAAALNDADLAVALRKNKTTYAQILGQTCETDEALCQRMPAKIRNIIESLRGLE